MNVCDLSIVDSDLGDVHSTCVCTFIIQDDFSRLSTIFSRLLPDFRFFDVFRCLSFAVFWVIKGPPKQQFIHNVNGDGSKTAKKIITDDVTNPLDHIAKISI